MIKNKRLIVSGNKVVNVSTIEYNAIRTARTSKININVKEQQAIKRVMIRNNLSLDQSLSLINKNNIVATSLIFNDKDFITVKEQKVLSKRIEAVKNSNLASHHKNAALRTLSKDLLKDLIGKHNFQKLYDAMEQFDNDSEAEIKALDDALSGDDRELLIDEIKEIWKNKIRTEISKSSYYTLINIFKKAIL